MAVVAQLVEPSVVVRVVAGSSPVDRPILSFRLSRYFFSRSRHEMIFQSLFCERKGSGHTMTFVI